ncbi:MAG: hypothetical protein D3917_07315, partial [Candidatus Electrothrix sp. AX5]|nr:hypothetical protein [Candidatus Electrothrix sp. AX5]
NEDGDPSDGVQVGVDVLTDVNGEYSFPNVPPGTYVVVETNPVNHSSVFDKDGDMSDPAANRIPVIATAGGNHSGNDFLDVQDPAVISGTVTLDADRDGAFIGDAEDTNLSGVTVQLFTDPNEDGDPSDGVQVGVDVLTDVNGEYSFPNVPPGSYVVIETNPVNHSSVFDKDSDTSDPMANHIPVMATAGGNHSGNDFLDVQDPAVIGNRIWLDENGDGVQDAGEAGISNVKLELRDSGGNLVSNTVTGDNGEYIFTDIPPGDYTVHVVDGVTNLHNTYDKDTGTTTPDNEASVSVTAGETNFTVDFGYNWVDPIHTDNPPPGATGAIGDRIWNDADGDGVQDPGESGIKGVIVTLLTDDNGDGLYGGVGDNLTPLTTITDATGRYIFDDLAPGSYVIETTPPGGYTQTGDPDEPGVIATLGDNRTTDPVVLAPGDVYVNADFGYKAAGSTSTIGDRIYLDANGDGTDDGLGTEPGFAGVTVALKNGLDEIIAYDVTDKDGKYLFPGLPSDTYTVEVTDTRNVLGQFTQTGDPGGSGSLDNAHTQPVTAGTNYLDADFGYAPKGHTHGEGLIGDTVYLDLNNDGNPDAGEGMEGVTVNLCADAACITPLASTVTNQNGQYSFGNLPDRNYSVQVDTSTLPGTGLVNTKDQDGDNDNKTPTTISGGSIHLDRDFAYQKTSDPNTISGTIWDDTNADGTLNDTGKGFSGITIVLRDASTGNIIATTTTDSTGDYSFGNLPDGDYTVEVDDQDGSLEGFWHSDGLNDGMDNNSQVNGYSINVSGSETNNTGDFGYYRSTSSVGDLLWEDTNGDGIFDSGSENPIPHHKVTLVITYPNGDIVTLVTETDATGKYSFANLLADENYQSSGSEINQPTYVIKVDPPVGMVSTHTPATDAADADNQADNPEGEFVALTKGEVLETKDFGFRNNGSIGDYVWLDINADGKQDLNESPLGGVTVKLYRDVDSDGNFDPGGTDGTVVDTVTTNLDGSYLFENLPEGNYWVQIDSSTLPADLVLTTTHTDNGNFAHLVSLAPSENNDTVDFGLNATATTAVLGDTVWFDIDPDGVLGGAEPNGIQDPGEIGIAGVGLYICLNDIDPCDGTNDIDTGSTGPTVITEADGSWLVTGLTPGQIYTVAANTSTLPAGMDSDPTNGDLRRVYTMPADGSSLLIADYGFTDNDGTPSYGTIGDRVYQDENGDGDDESGSDPGISGVSVELLNDSSAVIATTVTDINGNYSFTGLKLDKEYTVRIKSDSDILSTMTRTQTGSTDDSYTFIPTAATPNKTDADFGFTGSGFDLGDYIWFDESGNGLQDAGESGISNVEVRLYLDNGGTQGSKDGTDTLLRTVTTDSNGKYLFSGLATGEKYIVEVVPPAGFPPSSGPETVTDGTSNSDGNAEVDVDFTATTLEVDFGFTGGSYSIGNKIWLDEDGDRSIDGDEVGIDGVTLDLYLDGHRIASTTTSGGGLYRFNYLPSGNYEVRVTDQAHLLTNYGFTTDGGDSQTASVSSETPHSTNNFGVNLPLSTYAVVSTFDAYINADNQVVLEWTTSSEIGTIGFTLERLSQQDGKYHAVTNEMLPGMLTPPHGGTYRYIDKTAKPGRTYTYRVVEVAVKSQGTISDSYTVQASKSLPVNNEMFAGGLEGYSLTHQDF